MSFGNAMAGVTDNIVRQFGTTVTLGSEASVYDPTTAETTVTRSDTTVPAVLSVLDEAVADGEILKAGDMKALVAAQSLGSYRPEPGNTLTVLSSEYRVTQAEPIVVTGTEVSWWIIARK